MTIPIITWTPELEAELEPAFSVGESYFSKLSSAKRRAIGVEAEVLKAAYSNLGDLWSTNRDDEMYRTEITRIFYSAAREYAPETGLVPRTAVPCVPTLLMDNPETFKSDPELFLKWFKMMIATTYREDH